MVRLDLTSDPVLWTWRSQIERPLYVGCQSIPSYPPLLHPTQVNTTSPLHPTQVNYTPPLHPSLVNYNSKALFVWQETWSFPTARINDPYKGSNPGPNLERLIKVKLTDTNIADCSSKGSIILIFLTAIWSIRLVYN